MIASLGKDDKLKNWSLIFFFFFFTECILWLLLYGEVEKKTTSLGHLHLVFQKETWHLSGLLVLLLWQNTRQKQPKEGKVYLFWLVAQLYKSLAAGGLRQQAMLGQVREQRDIGAVSACFLPFSSIPGSQHLEQCHLQLRWLLHLNWSKWSLLGRPGGLSPRWVSMPSDWQLRLTVMTSVCKWKWLAIHRVKYKNN